MKKGTSLFFISIAILGITLFSCKLKIEDTDLYDAPLAHITESQITIVIPKMNSDTKYINIYRRDKTDNNEIINIALLYQPLALEKDNKTFIYTDSLVLQNHSYDYMVRYYSDGEYYYSAWSEIIEVETGTYSYPAGTSLKFETSGAKLIYEKSNHTLTINGTITIPGITNFATEYYPMLIIKSETATQTFLISSIADGTDIPLVGMLPQEFLDTDITIQGIVGQKLEFDDISKPVNEWQLKSVSWTEPAPITVIGAGSSKIINIPSQNGSEGFDYSRKAQ